MTTQCNRDDPPTDQKHNHQHEASADTRAKFQRPKRQIRRI